MYFHTRKSPQCRSNLVNKITLPQLAWHGVKKLKISLPENWQMEVCNMAGYNRPKMKPAEIKKAIGSPIGMAPLREYARGKKEAVILMGPFGNTIAGQLKLQMQVPPNVNRLIIFSEYPELSSKNYLEDTDKVVLMHNWEDVLALLKQRHGAGSKVAVYPDADIQYCAG